MNPNTIWTRALDEPLTAAWTRGDSTIAIAAELAALSGLTITKNMVVGRVHRLKLPARTSPIKGKPGPVAKELFRLPDLGCRYIAGDPKASDPYCGKERLGSASYCPEHLVLCHAKRESRAA